MVLEICTNMCYGSWEYFTMEKADYNMLGRDQLSEVLIDIVGTSQTKTPVETGRKARVAEAATVAARIHTAQHFSVTSSHSAQWRGMQACCQSTAAFLVNKTEVGINKFDPSNSPDTYTYPYSSEQRPQAVLLLPGHLQGRRSGRKPRAVQSCVRQLWWYQILRYKPRLQER